MKMFNQSAAYYDAIYCASGKDYAGEVQRLQEIIQSHKRTSGNTLLDVACGTGGHLAYLAHSYQVEGLDADDTMLQVAKHKFPDTTFHCSDMVDFALDRSYDIITCLFSSIGYVKTLPRLQQAIGTIAHHLVPGGLLIIEPWFQPGSMQAGRVFGAYVEQPDCKVARMSLTEIAGDLSILHFHYLIGTSAGIAHVTERHELGLFSHEAYLAAFGAQELRVTYDAEGLTGRGLYIGQKRPVDLNQPK
jgi:SAM-dependent methyltransferase